MPSPRQASIRVWQWPNVLALDAALIAVLWQAALAAAMGLTLAAPTYFVLGLSVWLSYTADRLLDAARRDSGALLSTRHRFAKRRRTLLVRVWWAVLLIDGITATQLSADPIKQGSALLLLCLLYTWLNQKLSRHFFPKELCVALIYAGGVAVLLPKAPPFTFLGLFAFLCLLNCLMIAKNEATVDAHLRVRSIAGWITAAQLSPLFGLGVVLAFFAPTPLKTALISSFALLGLVHACRTRLPTETFRLLADGVLLIGPALCLTVAWL
jgi:hypothetical protein